MDFISMLLKSVFRKDHDAATQIMMHVHSKGVGVCGAYTREVAEPKVRQVIQNGLYGTQITCNDCHATHPDIDHSAIVTTSGTLCANCHTDTPLVDASDSKSHNGCGNCHDANGDLINSAIGKTFSTGGTCATCHTADWDVTHTTAISHTGIVTVAATTCGGSCHADTPLTSGANDTHDACTSCHDGTTGA